MTFKICTQLILENAEDARNWRIVYGRALDGDIGLAFPYPENIDDQPEIDSIEIPKLPSPKISDDPHHAKTLDELRAVLQETRNLS